VESVVLVVSEVCVRVFSQTTCWRVIQRNQIWWVGWVIG